jgi:uncharacterized protein
MTIRIRKFPFAEFVLKVYSDCNLRCSYCYVYFGKDQSWKEKPKVVSEQVMRDTARRIAEHVKTYGLKEISVVLHGGEPLMAGVKLLIHYVELIREAVGDDCHVDATIQTNGTLLTEKRIQMLEEARIGIGVSLDGGTAKLNRHRVFLAGKPALKQTVRGLKLLAARGERNGFRAYRGILCTVEVNNLPVEVFESLLRFDPPSVNFLLPHANHETPPQAPEHRTWYVRAIEQVQLLFSPNPHQVFTVNDKPYGVWLGELFDRWFFDKRLTTHILLFESIISLLRGGTSPSEEVGLSPYVAVVVETDGEIEQVDALKTAFAGAPYTGLNVHDDSFDLALDHPAIIARQMGVEGLSPKCQMCTLKTLCGGGNHTHRYKDGHFNNPSVYCRDLEYIIRHISQRIMKVV